MDKTLNQETYERFRRDIMTFALKPGERVSAGKLAEVEKLTKTEKRTARRHMNRTPAKAAAAVMTFALSMLCIGPIAAFGAADPGNEAKSEQEKEFSGSFDVNRFVLPEGAGALVVVEGTGGSACVVYAFERMTDEKGNGHWEQLFETDGCLGRNGMNNYRVEGDKTTPIGLFRMDTPFGQKPALEGFPDNYIQVTKNHVWSRFKNRLTEDPSEEGERVGTSGYAGYYDYAINAGYNPNAVKKKGSALFIHCRVPERTDTSGCVAIPSERMIDLMRLYGRQGDGNCYIAQAPRGTFDMVYDTFGIFGGLSPNGDFTKSEK